MESSSKGRRFAGPWLGSAWPQPPVTEVAVALGLILRRRAMGPCSACGAERRGARDGRLPVGIRSDDQGWRCFSCGASGDGLDLAALALHDRRLRDCDAPRRESVREWLGANRWPSTGNTGEHRPIARVLASTRPPTSPPARPPPGEVDRLWRACRPVKDDPEVEAWLTLRALDAGTVADRDLARALPSDLALPRWARCMGRPWSDGWRCILPAWGHTGRLVSLRARWLGTPPDKLPKASAASAGPGSATGLVLADGLAGLVLAQGAAPSWWPVDRPLDLIIAEGETDYLTWATHWADVEIAPAVLGVWAGAWTEELAARIPDGARVLISTDRDPAGDDYARRIATTLTWRCDVTRLAGEKP